jgi:predicted ATPase/class 3 adenylate cyclase
VYDLYLRPVDVDVVQQPEIDDVHSELGVFDLAQRLDHVVFCQCHAPSVARCNHDSVDLPGGTVTLLFTDIEGSTRLLDALGAAYSEALAEHRRLVRASISAHGGIEVDTQGDAFLCVFRSARDAVLAATAAQRALAPTPVRIRIGVHTGEPALTDEGYVGLDVHRGARICAAAHGGQILVSSTTRNLLDGKVELRDLGAHRLKDLAEPQQLYQVVAEELEQDFGPLRTETAPSNLPVPASPLIGRGDEIASVEQLLQDGARLITLTGPGGMGKTRLALAVAARVAPNFPDGAFFVGLAAVTDPDLVSPMIASALGVNELSGQSLARLLGARRMVLVLDNLEQLAEASPQIAGVLEAGPDVVVLATSRAPLRLTAERVYAVPPLADDDAVALFVARAQTTAAPEVAELCRRLDGLPLAIELAAARASVLSPAAILARLEQRLALLTSGPRDVPERQRTLRAAIEWSVDLLDDDARSTFARLSVFARGFTLDAAEAICGDDVFEPLAMLVDHSLLRRTGERFWMLESIREFARESLAETPEEDELHERHTVYYIDLVERAYAGRLEAETRWADTLEEELENLRAALDRLAPDAARLLQLTGALGWFFHLHSHLAEGRERLDAALAESGGDPRHRARALAGAGTIAGWTGDLRSAREQLEAAIALWRELDEPVEAGLALDALGWVLFVCGEVVEGLQRFEDALDVQRDVGTPLLVNRALVGVCQGLVALGDTEAAEPRAHELLELARREDDVRSEHFAHHFLADCALMRDDCATADDRYRRSLLAALPLGDAIETSFEIQGLAMAAAGLGYPERALRLAGAGAAIWEETGAALDVPFWLELLDKWLTHARASLPEDEASRAWEAGRQLSFERAIEEALEPARA